MTDNQQDLYNSHLKTAWRIYTVLVAIVVAVLVLFVAQDNEERLFYGLMGSAAAYVFRPTERTMAKKILKYTGVAKPEPSEQAEA
jgi:hypothetical protein